jgi:hypothetical protein
MLIKWLFDNLPDTQFLDIDIDKLWPSNRVYHLQSVPNSTSFKSIIVLALSKPTHTYLGLYFWFITSNIEC